MFARKSSGRKGNLFLELLLIVVGINIALWFEGLAEDYRDAQSEQDYLQGLHDDLSADKASIAQLIELNKLKLESVNQIIPQLDDLNTAPREAQGNIIFDPATYHFFEPSDFTYLAMQESGDFRLLQDPELKRELLRLVREYRSISVLQDNFIQALDDIYIPLIMGSFDMLTFQLSNAELPEEQSFRNFFAFTLQETSMRLEALQGAEERVAALLLKIEGQID